MAKDDGHIIFTEEQKAKWKTYLDDFDKDVYPIFLAHGYTKETALSVWMMNRLYNALDPDKDDDWNA